MLALHMGADEGINDCILLVGVMVTLLAGADLSGFVSAGDGFAPILGLRHLVELRNCGKWILKLERMTKC
jgi:hypothetical protein